MCKLQSCFGMMLALVLMPASASSAYPEKPITILVGYSAGGLSDMLARVIGEKLHAKLGQPVVVDIKSGANSSIATAALAKSKPDGYTLAIVTSNHVTNPVLMDDLSYSAADFAAVSMLAKVPIVFTVSTKATSARDLMSFLAEGRNKPDGILYASAGSGNMTHLTGEALADATGQTFTQVPYRGGAAAILDLMGGQVPSQFVGGPQTLLAQMQGEGAKLLHPLAITSQERISSLPDVPTFAELGFPQLVISEWQALMAPARTPSEIVSLLSRALGEVLQMPDVQQKLPGVMLTGSTPHELENFLQIEANRWSVLLEKHKARR